MKNQAFNPILPSREYTPDVEPYVIGNRLYLYGSHDAFNGSYFCVNDYVCWSAPIDNLGDWKFEGVIYKKEQDPLLSEENKYLFAPDIVQGKDGKWYLYYTLGSSGVMSVAVADNHTGPYEFYGTVKERNGHIIGTEDGDIFQFDPAVIIDGQKALLYTGFSPREGKDCDKLFGGRLWDGSYCYELEDDMLTVKGLPKLIVPGIKNAKGTSFEEHPFFEASSIRKIGKKYYFVYSSVYGHELCYAISDYPDKCFIFGGVLVSNGDVHYQGRTIENALNYMGNNHGGMVKIKNQWYIFYHRYTNLSSFSRQACAEKIYIDKSGHIEQVEMTSCGLNNGTLVGYGYYPSYIACNIVSSKGAGFIEKDDGSYPKITQDGDGDDGNDQYISNLRDESVVGFKYFDLRKTKGIEVYIRSSGIGKLQISSSKKLLCTLNIGITENITSIVSELCGGTDNSELYFKYSGTGALDFIGFKLL